MNFSASSLNPDSSTELASLYECPVCYEYISPPLLQCSNGHMVCFSCRPKLNCCPSCKAPLGTSRNLLMEKALSHVNFPCKFTDQGCLVTMLLRDKSTHEGKCAFRPAFSCFYCKWEGAMGHVFSHFLNHHPWIKMTQGDNITLRVFALMRFPSLAFADGADCKTVLEAITFCLFLKREKSIVIILSAF